MAKSYNNIGNVYNSQGKYEEALEVYTKSFDIKTRIYGGDNHLDVAASKYNIASLKETQGDWKGRTGYFSIDRPFIVLTETKSSRVRTDLSQGVWRRS